MKARYKSSKAETPLLDAMPAVAKQMGMTGGELLALCVILSLGQKRINEGRKLRVLT